MGEQLTLLWNRLPKMIKIEIILSALFILSVLLPWDFFIREHNGEILTGGYNIIEIIAVSIRSYVRKSTTGMMDYDESIATGKIIVYLFVFICLMNIGFKLFNQKTKIITIIVVLYPLLFYFLNTDYYSDHFKYWNQSSSFLGCILCLVVFIIYLCVLLYPILAEIANGTDNNEPNTLTETTDDTIENKDSLLTNQTEQTNADTIIDNKDAKVDRNETIVELKSKSLSWLKEHQKLVSYLGGAFVAIIIAAVVLPKIFSTSVEKELGIVNYNWDKFVKITNHDTLHGWFHKKPSDNSALLQKCWAVSDEPDAEIGFIWTGEKWTEEMEKTGYDVSNYQFYDGDIFPLLGEEGDFFKVQLNNGPQQSGIEIAYINKECGKIIKSRPIDSELLRNYPRINVIPKGKYKNLALMGQPGNISEVGVLVNGHIIVPEQNVITDQSVITDESDLEDEAKVATIVNMIKKDNPQYEMVAYSLEGNDNNMWTDYFKIK